MDHHDFVDGKVTDCATHWASLFNVLARRETTSSKASTKSRSCSMSTDSESAVRAGFTSNSATFGSAIDLSSSSLSGNTQRPLINSGVQIIS